MARAIAFNNSRDSWTETRKIRKKNLSAFQIAWIMLQVMKIFQNYLLENFVICITLLALMKMSWKLF